MDVESYMPGASSIVEQIDKRLLLILSDGRHLIGTLRTFDQYLNLVLENTLERVIYEVRGDNIIIFGELDQEKEKNLPLKAVSQEQLREMIASGQKKSVEWNIEG